MTEPKPIFLKDSGQKSGETGRRPGFLVPLACAGVLMLAAFLLLAPRQAAAVTPKTVAGVASVVDADTLDIHGQRIRLTGVDAPESGQKCQAKDGRFVRCGTIAANALDQWINRNPVTCTIEGKDRYKRLLAECSVRGASVQEWLVVNGHALAYRSYSTAYVPAENRARAAKSGMWAGRFISPWDWRQGARLPGEKPTKAMLSGKIAARD